MLQNHVYTGNAKSTGTPGYFLNGLILPILYLHQTYYSILWFYWGWNFFSTFEKGVKGGNSRGGKGGFFNIYSNLVSYGHLLTWKGLLTRKITTLRKGFYNNPVRNGSLSKLEKWWTLIGCPFWPWML